MDDSYEDRDENLNKLNVSIIKYNTTDQSYTVSSHINYAN